MLDDLNRRVSELEEIVKSNNNGVLPQFPKSIKEQLQQMSNRQVLSSDPSGQVN